MERFYFIVLTVAIVVLLLILIILGIIMSRKKNKLLFPPTYNQCPDYWATNSDKTCQIPPAGSTNSISTVGLSGTNTPGYNGSGGSINFSNPGWNTLYPGLSPTCAMRKWCNSRQVTWDGISNYNGC